MNEESQSNLKNHLILRENSLVFKFAKHKKIANLSVQHLAQAIIENIKNNDTQKVLISHQGTEVKNDYFKNFNFIFLDSKNFKVFNYENAFGVDNILNEIVYRKEHFDYSIHLVFAKKNKALEIQIRDNNFQLISNELINKIYSSYKNKILEFKTIHELKSNIIPIQKYIDLLASKDEILKAFANVKQRYKTSSLIYSDSTFSRELLSSLFTGYNNSFEVLNRRKISFLATKITMKFFPRVYLEKKHIENIFYMGAYNDLHLALWIDRHFKWVEFQTLVLIYLDFLLEEIKRTNKDISQLFVVIPQNASFRIVELLKKYKVKTYFYNNNEIDKWLSDENCLFAYLDEQAIANPRYSKHFNNYYFAICLLWMFNTYANRNNLLSFKYNQLNDRLGKFKLKKSYIKEDYKNIETIIKYISNTHREYSKVFQGINVYRSWNGHKYMLLKLLTDKKHQVILYWDDNKQKLVVEYQLCLEYEEKANNTFFDLIKMKLAIHKMLRKSKNFVASKNTTQIDKQTK